jgi:rod shape-determining protein MreD
VTLATRGRGGRSLRSGWGTGVRAALVILVVLVVQATLMADLRVAGALGDLVLVLVVAAGLTGGPDRGATYGFVAGLGYDLVLDTPFGLSPLVYALIGFAVGLVGLALLRTSGWWPPAVAAGAAVVQAVLYTALGNLIGVAYPFGGVPTIALVQAAWCAALILPALRVLWWVHGHSEADRLEVVLR